MSNVTENRSLFVNGKVEPGWYMAKQIWDRNYAATCAVLGMRSSAARCMRASG